MPNFFDKEKHVLHFEILQLYLFKARIEAKIHCVLELNQWQCLKPYVEFNTHKKNYITTKNGDKDGKALYKLTNNAVYGKIREKLRIRIYVRLISSKEDYLKWASKPNHMLQKIFDNDLVAIRKSKVTLKLKKPVYNGTCILDLGKVLMYEFYYDYFKNKYGNISRLLFIDTDSLMYEIKTEDVYEDFSNHSAKSKYYDDSNKLVVGKMKDKMVWCCY